jgi:hypothetical protein
VLARDLGRREEKRGQMDKKTIKYYKLSHGFGNTPNGRLWPLIPHIPLLMTLAPEVSESPVVNIDNHTK